MKFKLTENFLNETDNAGNGLSEEQSKFFKNSKVRDKNGCLMVCYHGATNPGFTVFNPREQSKSQFGKYKFKNNAMYFTASK